MSTTKSTETTTKTSFWSTIWAWIKKIFGKVEETGLSSVINWIKTKFGEGKVVADQKNFSSWAEYIIALLTDMYNWMTSSSTTSTDNTPTKSSAPRTTASKYKTQVIRDLVK